MRLHYQLEFSSFQHFLFVTKKTIFFPATLSMGLSIIPCHFMSQKCYFNINSVGTDLKDNNYTLWGDNVRLAWGRPRTIRLHLLQVTSLQLIKIKANVIKYDWNAIYLDTSWQNKRRDCCALDNECYESNILARNIIKSWHLQLHVFQ